LAAARQAERLRSEARLTWAEILVPALPPARSQLRSQSVAEAVAFLLDRWDALTEWEVEFADGIRRQRSPLSPKQREILDRLVETARRAEARAA
jgi:hypothetical protein